MYFKVVGRYKSEDGDNPTFEYVADVDTKERVYDMAEDAGEEVLSISEITISELIEREKAMLMDTVVRTYVFARYRDEDFDTRLEKVKKFDRQSEDFYLALQEFNRRQMYLRRLMHRRNKGKIDLNEFLQMMNGLVDCTEEEDVDNLIRKMEDKLE